MARLRNRILKADFWSDGELLRWPREKRFTYAGLYAMAEDSGCIEDDPFTWKILIWGSPLDNDVTVEMIAQWRDDLCDAGKLVPYHEDGQQYLYIKSFHEHEHPRNPQSPSIPLPAWVTYVPGSKADHTRARYEVSEIGAKAKRKPSKALAKTNGNGASEDASFDEFWAVYMTMRHEDKLKAKTAWKQLPKGEQVLALGVAQIMAAMVQAKKKPKKYVPHATTFIHGKRWEDWREGVPADWEDESEAQAQAQQDILDDAILAAYKEES